MKAKPVLFALSTLAMTGALLMPLMSLADTANCFFYKDPCFGNVNCGSTFQSVKNYCKQICYPNSDTGCCAYTQTTYSFFTDDGPGQCPCSGQTGVRNDNIHHTPTSFCYKPDDTQAPCNTDTQNGTCKVPS